ncbi:MAG: hydroxymethylbilane synthase [Burkholderiaceae bacterium]|nr:hydroxymethylbilane synthase [Burkholderiaceae bacterium]MDP4969342.1 hydroxymethylbilane synthase [Burkholderiaceae bacterium]MDP5111331.1 hydroxymethylbilane synthase [Burkholderiaceae bacterium]
MSSRNLVIATRASRLALWQAEHVQARLREIYPDVQVDLLKLSTRGDEILDRSLSKVGGKGLFIKELEYALLDGRADLAVHSLKDVPVDMEAPFELSTVLSRADCRDAFVSNDYADLSDLPAGAIVGTSSLRREAQLRARYPELVIHALRGNLDTRLGKLDRGEYAAIILASAGLERLGLSHRIRLRMTTQASLPAAGQGALGIEILQSRSDLRELLAPLACPDTTVCTLAERAVSRALGGSCQVPLAAYAQLDGERLKLRALVATPDGKTIYRAQLEGAPAQAEQLGFAVAQQLITQGAGDILASLTEPS